MDQNTFDINQVIEKCAFLTQKDQDKDQIQSSKDYLLAFHKSEQSWSILCDILTMENVSAEVTLQAAKFLKQKFQYDFYQLPQTEYWNMAHSIIRFLMKNSDLQVNKKLSRSFVLLYLHAFETLGDVIEILENTLLSIDEKKSVAINILRLIPGVLHMKSVVISKKKKGQYIAYVESKLTTKVFDILETLGKNENLSHEVKNNTLQACNEWIFFSKKNKSLVNDIHKQSCFQLALSAIQDPILARDARCVLNIGIKTVKHSSSNPHIYKAICSHLVEYIDGCNKVIKGNPEHLLEYMRLFSTFGAIYLEIMVSESDQNLVPFIKYMKELVVNHELSGRVIEELEDFWGNFPADFIENFQDSSKLSNQLDIIQFFKEFICALINKMQLNPEILKFLEDECRNNISTNNENVDQNDESEEKTKEIEKHREEKMPYKQILLNVQDIIGFDSTFTCIHNVLKDFISTLNQNNANWENLSWTTMSKLECILYAAKTSILAAETKEKFLSEFLELIVPLKLSSVKINKTKIDLIVCIASQLSTLNEELQSSAIYYILEQAQDPANSDAAGEALISVFEDWHEFVVKNVETFLEFRNKFERDYNYFRAMAKAISQANLENQTIFIAELCKPSIERFARYVESGDDEPTEDAEKEIKIDLKILGLIFAQIPKAIFDNPLDTLMPDLWPIFKTAFQKYNKHTKILLHLCNVTKRCMRSLEFSFKPFVSEFVEAMCEGFKKNPLGSFLYGLEVTASIFGKQPDMAETITRAYENISKTAVDFMSGKDMKEYNELFEDFFGMLFRFVKHMPQAVLYPETFEKVFHFTELAIGCKEPNIEKTVLLFLEYLFGQCKDKPNNPVSQAVTKVISEKYGAIYIKKLMAMYIEYPQEPLRDYTLDVFFQSFKKLRDNTLVWFESAFEEIPEAILTQNEKRDMLESLSKINERNDGENSDSANDMQDRFGTIFESLEERCKIIRIRKRKFEEVLTQEEEDS